MKSPEPEATDTFGQGMGTTSELLVLLNWIVILFMGNGKVPKWQKISCQRTYPRQNRIVVGIAERSSAKVVEKHDVVKVGQVPGSPKFDKMAEEIFSQDFWLFRPLRRRSLQGLQELLRHRRHGVESSPWHSTRPCWHIKRKLWSKIFRIFFNDQLGHQQRK